MALTLTSQAAAWHPLIEIADVTIDGVTGQTLRWSDAALSLSDGTYYAPMVSSVSPLRQELGRLLEAQFVAPDLVISLINTDDVARELLDENRNFAGKTVTLKMGQGTVVADYDVKFTGQVRFPDGVTWDDQTVQLSLDNSIEADSDTLPRDKIWGSSYPHAHATALYAPIPEILGDWRTTAGGGEQVPCYCVDTTAGTGGQWLIAEHCDSIEAVYINGTPAAYTQNSLAPALVTINVACSPDTDLVTANVVGRTSSLLGRGNCVEWAYDLLTQSWGLAVAAGRVDATAFAAVAAGYYGSGDVARRWIGAETSSNTLLAELSIDGFFDLIIDEDGKYQPVFRYAPLTGAEGYRAVDIRSDSQGRRLFSVQSDPERTYVNQLPYDYRLEASAADIYAVSDLVEDATEQTAVGQTVRRRLRLRWLYLTAGADDRAGREMMAFATHVELVSLQLGPRALALKPSDTFLLYYSRYEVDATVGTPMSVRSIEPDYLGMQASVVAWNMDDLSPKRYQADGSAAWAGASLYAQTYYGFYSHDASQVYF